MTGLRGLTVLQPWMWSILQSAPSASYGGRYGKPEENRRWPVPGGRLNELALHAGARSGWDEDGERSVLVRKAWHGWAWHGKIGAVPPVTVPPLCRESPYITFSAIVAVAEGVTCHHATDCVGPAWVGDNFQDALCSPWSARGAYHWQWEALHVLAEPVSCRGYQKLWPVPEDIESAVRAQLEASHA